MNYIEEAIKTEIPNYEGPCNRAQENDTMRIVHAVMGVSTESGEMLDNIKRHLFYGKNIDYINLKEEAGDVMYYLAILCHELGVSFEEVQETNIKKLKARYPDKFTKEKALERDLEKERKILEGNHE